MEYKEHIENAFYNAENNISKITDELLNIEGFSGSKTRHFYNNLLNMQDARYLEIGTWKGSSVCSAMYGNKANIVCIDNWAEFGGPKEEFLFNFNKFRGENNASFIEINSFNIDVLTLPKFNIYMYDGDHSYDSHYKALTHYINCLDDTFIFVVDDWNWVDVRNATLQSIKDLNLKVLYEKDIKLNNDNISTHDRNGWWNRIYVAILQK